MEEGKICSFKDNTFVECKIFIENGKPMYEISEPIIASKKLRDIHKIAENGTIAYFRANPEKNCKVPQFSTIHEQLANNYILRKIMINSKRRILLFNEDQEKPITARYRMPIGKETLSEDFIIAFDKYNDFPIHISIYRAENELLQIGDDRSGGLLIVDDADAVLGISLFKYDNEPLAARFFGEIKITRFRELLENEEAVLSEERDGLVARHPFCQKLIIEVEKRIEKQVKEEKERRQKEDQSKIDIEEATRYKKAFSILNDIAEIEAQSIVNLGQNTDDKIIDPPDGFCFYPSSAQITVMKRYNFELRINREIVRPGSIVKISSTNTKINSLCSEFIVERESNNKILQKYITVEGKEPNIEGTLRAITGNKLSDAKIYVVPEKELLLDEGMVFQPESITLHPNQSRKVYLLIYVKMIEGGSIIQVKSDNESVQISKSEIVVNESDAIRHIAKYELEIWGEGVGQDALITAGYENYMAILEVKVRAKEDEEKKRQKGMFNEPEFDYDHEPIQRVSYSQETGRIMIYVNFPSVKHYIGDLCQYRKTLPAQVFIADLVSEKCFNEIAKKKVESSGAIINPASIHERIQRDAFDLSKRYGKKVHEVLVDQNMLKVYKKK